jgi:PKHD-type hydroxylase
MSPLTPFVALECRPFTRSRRRRQPYARGASAPTDSGASERAARPKAIVRLLISRYEPGMAYGTHVDDALMGGMRTDLSFTLFLCEPESYEGGALVMDDAYGEREVRLPAGELILYASTALHRVEPVTSGVRLAAVGWVRSFVRDSSRREVLFDLETALRGVHETAGKTPLFDLLAKTRTNLLRMWAED